MLGGENRPLRGIEGALGLGDLLGLREVGGHNGNEQPGDVLGGSRVGIRVRQLATVIGRLFPGGIESLGLALRVLPGFVGLFLGLRRPRQGRGLLGIQGGKPGLILRIGERWRASEHLPLLERLMRQQHSAASGASP